MHILENKYGGNEPFNRERPIENEDKQNAHKKRSVWLWGFSFH